MADRVEILIVGYDEVFLDEARACVTRSQQGAKKSNSALQAGAAGSAVVAACASVESFVSERTAFHAKRAGIPFGLADQITGSAKVFQRLNWLVKHFDGEGLTGHTDYEPFQAVVALRNCIVHRKAEYLVTADWPPEIEEKHRSHIPYGTGADLDWTSRVFHEDVAAWAVAIVERLLSAASVQVSRPPNGTVHNFVMEVGSGFTISG